MNSKKEELYKLVIKLYDECRWTADMQGRQEILKEIIEAKEMLALYDTKGKHAEPN